MLAAGNILRGNQVRNQTTLVAAFSKPVAANKKLALAYAGRDTIFEDNQVADAEVGIKIDRYFIDSLVRNNRFEGCRTKIQDQGGNTLIIGK